MNTIKSFLIGTLVVLALASVILGPRKVLSHMVAGRELISSSVDEVSSDAQQAARIRVLLQGLDDDILEYQDKLADVEWQLADDRRVLQRLEAEIGNQREILAKERAMLQQDMPSYEIQGKVYSSRKVEEDALSRISHTKSLEQQFDLKRQVVARLEAALNEGRTNLAKAMTARREKVEELKVLEARLRNARVLSQVAEIAKDLGEAPLAPQSELGKALRTFEKRVRDAERRNDVLSTEARGGMVIDWEGGSDLSASQALDEFLDSPRGDQDSASTSSKKGVVVELGRALGSAD